MLYHGACYYPEHWTAEQARQHKPLMQKAGFNVVRMGEFAWCKFQPDQGRFKFDWLDPVIEALDKAGIKTVLGTPTAIPPQWAIVRYPDMLQKDQHGHVRNEPVAGRAAITCHRLGKGRVYYLGVYLPAPALRDFLRDCLPEFPIRHIPDGVEVTVRRGAKGRLLFLINHRGNAAS